MYIREVKTIIIEMPDIILPVNSVLVSSSYQVARKPDFNNLDNIILESLDDTVNLYKLEADIEIYPEETVYTRTWYKYNQTTVDPNTGANVITLKESRFSAIQQLNSRTIGLKVSTNIVRTPIVYTKITYADNPEGELIITSSEMKMFSGVGQLESVDYKIVTSDGEIILDRLMDKDNLASYTFPIDKFKHNTGYYVLVRHNSNTNATSYYGKSLLVNKATGETLYHIELANRNCLLVAKRWIYFRITTYVLEVQAIDIIIQDVHGKIVARNSGQFTEYPGIYTGNLISGATYTVLSRIKIRGIYTPYRKILEAKASNNVMNIIDSALPYRNKFTYSREIQLGGANTICAKEACNNVIFMFKHNDPNIYSFSIFNKRINEVNTAGSLPMDFNGNTYLGRVYANIISKYDGNITIDIATGSLESQYRHPAFITYKFNTGSNTLSQRQIIQRENEVYSTCVSSSAVPDIDNNIWYIPAEYEDRSQLQLLKYNIKENTISVISELPFLANKHVSMLAIDSDRLLVFGGTNQTDDVNINNDETWTRSNNLFYIYNRFTNVWDLDVATLPSTVSSNIYNLCGILRKDGNVVIFNNTENTTSRIDQSTIIFNPNTLVATHSVNDYGDTVPYTSTVEALNGDIYRISARELDPQKIFLYPAGLIADEDIVDNTVINEIGDLVIPTGRTVMIENITKYDSVTIEGTSINNTGVLIYVEDDLRTLYDGYLPQGMSNRKEFIFKYYDLIITRDTIIVQDLYIGYKTWNSINLFNSATLTIRNVCHVPADVHFRLYAPVILDEWTVGAGGSLTIINENGTETTYS